MANIFYVVSPLFSNLFGNQLYNCLACDRVLVCSVMKMNLLKSVNCEDKYEVQSSFSIIIKVGNVVQYCTKLYSNCFIIFFEICNCYGYF